MIYIRSSLFYLGEALSTIPFFLLAFFALPFPAKTRSWLIARWAWWVTWWLRVTCGLSHQIEGTENIPDQPCVFACAHQSTWEAITTQTFLPALAWVLKKELFKIPFFGWGLWATRPIAIDRQEQKTALDQVVQQGQQKILEGRHVLIFPEGTRTSYGQVGRYRRGASRLARAANVDIIPIAHNAGKYWSNTSFWIKPGVIKVVIGAKIDYQDKRDREVTEEIKQWIVSQDL